MNTSRNITDLPLEVLGLIFKKLPSEEDRLSLAQVHSHIGLAFSCNYKYKTIKYDNRLPACDRKLVVIVPLCGSSVEAIDSYGFFDGSIRKLVEQHCPNLQSIKIVLRDDDVDEFMVFLCNVRSLKSLSLNNNVYLTRNILEIVGVLKLQPNLEKLSLWCFNVNVLLEVRDLVNLEELLIVGSMEVTPQRLQINENSELAASKEFVGVPCPALRELDIFNPYSYWQKPIIPAILKWILSHAETLEILKLGLEIPDCFQERVVCQILSKCRNLRSFRMQMNRVSAGFAHRVIEIVYTNGVASEERPLQLNFHDQSIHDDIQKVISNTPAKHLITIDQDV